MSFVKDKLYNGYVRRNMSTIVNSVNVRQIMIHLPCLTAHDRENIEAKAELRGNTEGMVHLLESLKRRENWPEQLIDALEACEQTEIAAEVRTEYNNLRGVKKLNPSSPPASVVTVHQTPASHESIPSAAQSPPHQVPKAAPPTEPFPKPPQLAQIEAPPRPSTPPPSPETQHAEAAVAPLPYGDINSHLEPEENSESDIQGENMSAENDAVTADRPHRTPAADTQPDPVQTLPATEDRTPQSPSLMNSDVTSGFSFLTLTPGKPPVQDTTPPEGKILTSDPPAIQTVERRPETETGATTFPELGAAGMSTSYCDDDDDDDDDVCLSKPGPLFSVQPQSHACPTISAPSIPEEPYSGDSGRLEMSESVSSCTPALPCQENGDSHEYNEPEENHYESPRESSDAEEVLVNVVRVSGQPSLLNQDGQSFTPQPSSTKAAESGSSWSSTCSPSEPEVSPDTKKGHGSENKADPHASSVLSANGTYILAALGVGACAALIAWRFNK